MKTRTLIQKAKACVEVVRTFVARHARLIRSVLGLLLVAALLYGAYRLWQDSQPFLPGYDAVLAPGSYPQSEAARADLADRELKPLIVGGMGVASVIDAVKSGDDRYYLFTVEPDHTELYRDSVATGLEQLTQSPGMKYDLTVDPYSGAVAYLSADSKDAVPHITLWDPTTGTEEDLGEGYRPYLLPGGFYLVAERDNAIQIIHTKSGEEYRLMTILPNAPFTVDTERRILAVYDPVNKVINEYSLASNTKAEFLTSAKIEGSPQAIGYAGETLVWVRRDDDDLVFATMDRKIRVSAGPTGSVSYKLSIYHD